MSDAGSTTTAANRERSRSPSTVDLGEEQERVHQQAYPERDAKGDYDPYLVRFEPGDPNSPKNWPRWKRWYITAQAGQLCFNATFASSAPAGVVPQLIEQFHLAREVAILCISLFVAAYCVGPLLWGPLSETYGRRPVFLVTFVCYAGFQIGCALSPNTASILIFRFLGGLFAAAPLTNSGALLADIWDPKTRGKAMSLFTIMPFAGPAVGPTVGGYIAVGGASWRWLFWVLAIYAGLCWVLIFFTLPETYEPILLVKKAVALRKQTGDERYRAPMEKNKVSFTKRLEGILARPFKILVTEPMLIAITLYMSFVYGCIYLLFEAYPIVFTEGHHLNAGASGLMFLPIPLGGATGIAIYLWYFNPRYEKAVDEFAPHPVPPEYRLECARYGGIIFATAFFWFGWTSYSSISYWVPLISGWWMGLGVLLIFLPLFNFIIDAYVFAAASALASSTVVRSTFGAGFPLFATQMYEKLNPRWASSLLGFIALAMVPIPFVLIKFGPKLREKSKYAPSRPGPPPAPKTVDGEKKETV